MEMLPNLWMLALMYWSPDHPFSKLKAPQRRCQGSSAARLKAPELVSPHPRTSEQSISRPKKGLTFVVVHPNDALTRHYIPRPVCQTAILNN